MRQQASLFKIGLAAQECRDYFGEGSWTRPIFDELAGTDAPRVPPYTKEGILFSSFAFFETGEEDRGDEDLGLGQCSTK